MGAAVAYYAFGGGAGHVCRSIAVLRQIQKQAGPVAIALTNSRFSSLYEREGIPHRLIATPSPDPRALAQQLHDAVSEFGVKVLVVDALPRGIFGEMGELLPRLDMPKVAVLRCLKRDYLGSHDVPRFIDAHYDRAVLCEGWPDDAHRALAIDQVDAAPILIRDSDELLARDQARGIMAAAEPTPLVVAVGAVGDASLGDSVFKLLAKIHSRGRTPRFLLRHAHLPSEPQTDPDAITHFPLIELLPGADVVVGACGYNLCHECRATATPAIFMPQRRLYDDQFWRARDADAASGPEQLEALLAQKLRSLPPRPERAPHYDNGAHRAAEAILALL